MKMVIELFCLACFHHQVVYINGHPKGVVECPACKSILGTLTDKDFMPHQIYGRIGKIRWREDA